MVSVICESQLYLVLLPSTSYLDGVDAIQRASWIKYALSMSLWPNKATVC